MSDVSMRDAAWFDREWSAAAKAVRRVIAARSKYDREDLYAVVMGLCWRKRESYQGDRPFSAWACRVAFRACLDHYRYRTEGCRRLDLQVPLDAPAPCGGSYHDVLSDPNPLPYTEEHFLFLRDLTLEPYRPLLTKARYEALLFATEGLSAAETAEVTNSDPNAVRSLLYGARKTIAAAGGSLSGGSR